MGSIMEKQIKFGDDETKGHKRYSGADPGQKSSFVGQQHAGIGTVVDGKPSFGEVHGSQPLDMIESDLVSAEDNSLVEIFQGSVEAQIDWLTRNQRLSSFQLVYWDPPFYSGKDYGDGALGFSDRWPNFSSYLAQMESHMRQLKNLLQPTGFLVLHCDWHASHYLKVMGDKLFGYDNFRNEIIWHYTGRRQPSRVSVNAKHDVLLIWAVSSASAMAPIFEKWNRNEYVAMKKQKVHRDEDGREWIWGHQGKGRSHAYRIYLDEVVGRGRAIDSVWDMPIINTSAKERVGYPTQKPLQLLERVILLLSKPGDWVADLMAGSGTTGVAAQSCGRHAWIGDKNPNAIEISAHRLKGVKNARLIKHSE